MRAIGFAIAVILLAGCATRPASAPSRQWQQPCDDCVRGVANFTKVTEKLWRGTQPNRDDPEVFRRLADAGVKTVINLRHDHDDFPLLRGTNIRYLRLPMRAWYPETEDLVLFLSALRRLFADPDSWPVYVHCAEGRDRTGYAIAAYRIIEDGWQSRVLAPIKTRERRDHRARKKNALIPRRCSGRRSQAGGRWVRSCRSARRRMTMRSRRCRRFALLAMPLDDRRDSFTYVFVGVGW